MADHIDLALLGVRVVVGVTLALHGINKVRGGLAGTGRWFTGIGFRWGYPNAIVAATFEIGGGLFFALGLLTPLAAAAIVGLMVVALITSHWQVGFFVFRPNQGIEYVLVLAVAAIAVGTIGPGEWSLDKAFGIVESGYQTTWWGLALSAAVGVVGALGQLAACWKPPAGALQWGSATKKKP
jgi:putative oxidoreductase